MPNEKVDPTIPENPDEILADVAADEAVAMAAEAAPAAPAVPEPKVKTMEEYLKEKQQSGARAGALFAVVEEDKSALAAQFKGTPVSYLCRSARAPLSLLP